MNNDISLLFRCVPLDFAGVNMAKVVNFPQLSSVHLDNYTNLCTAFLRHSKFQRLTSLDGIAASFELEDSDKYASLFDVCRHHFTPFFKIHPVAQLDVITTPTSVQAAALCNLDNSVSNLEAVMSVMLTLPLFKDLPPLVDTELVNLAANMVPPKFLAGKVDWAGA